MVSVVEVFVAVAMVVILVPALAGGYAVAVYANLPDRLGMLVGPLGVDRWAGLVPTVLFLAAVFSLSAIGTLPDEGEQGHLVGTLALLGVGVGLFGLALALGNFGRYRQIRAGDVAGGPVEAVGVDAATAPLTDEACLAWAVRVREHSGFFRRGAAPPIHEESGGAAFAVQTAVERVTVDPEAATLRAWSPLVGANADYVTRTRNGVSERVARFARERGLGEGDRTREYEQRRIEAGDEVTVVGHDGGGVPILGGSGPLVTPGDPEAVTRRLRRRVLAGPAGVVLATVSFGVAAAVAGVV